MKTLYISDLDGTLLNSSAELSDHTVDALNRFIKAGFFFSVATARSSGTAVKILEKLKINVPVILMNGVTVYDTVAGEGVKTEIIPHESAVKMLEVLRENSITGFLYTNEEDGLLTYYENLDAPQRKSFYDERVLKFGKRFMKVESFFQCVRKPIIYFSVCDRREVLSPVCEQLREDKNINVEFYRDVYLEDFWYLEICSAAASKFAAVNFLRERYGFERVVSFGDNLNDLPMFEASDESYAVSNAKDEVKLKADGVISDNNSDGVAHFLEENLMANS